METHTKENIQKAFVSYQKEISSKNALLVAVSKTYPVESIEAVYELGGRHFGENRVQELVSKYEALKNLKDIKWHQIGVLQSNKVKYITPFVHCIHSIDSEKLLQEVNKQAIKNKRKISCLMQVYIAQEETKQGWDIEELVRFFKENKYNLYSHIEFSGLMGMATFTDDRNQIEREFKQLYEVFKQIGKHLDSDANPEKKAAFKELSMGMSGDYKIALTCGSTMVRIGSNIFGSRV